MSRFLRKQNNRKLNKVIYIYSEGKETERKYFEAIKGELRLPTIQIKPIGTGYNTKSLVEFVIDKKYPEEEGVETEWWVVFDEDGHKKQFDDAIALAKRNGINVAYSNECFELWFILHFGYLENDIGRVNYNKKLDILLGTKYEKNLSNMYALIKDKESGAIRNAKKLEKDHDGAGVTSHHKRTPSTTVYLLVERLRALKAEQQ